MTVRIDVLLENSKTIVSVAGRLADREVRGLIEACRSIEGEFVLDLTNLRSAEAEGTKLIRELVRQGAVLRGASQYIRLLLDD